MDQKRFLISFIGTIFIFLCVALSIAYIGNPGGVYRTDPIMDEAIDALLDDREIIYPLNYDERLFQKKIIQQDNVTRNVIILGSSRAMGVNQTMITSDMNKTFLNHGIPSAVLQDELAILGMYTEKGDLPEVIVFCLDPWILNGNALASQWLMLREYYFLFLDYVGSSQEYSQKLRYWSIKVGYSELKKYLSALSYPLLSEAVRNIRDPDKDSWRVVQSNESASSKPLDVPVDGEIDINISIYSHYKNFYEIDSSLKYQFESTMAYLQSEGVTIIFVLPPVHPIYYDTLSRDPQYAKVFEAEEFFKHYAASHDIPLYDSYDPRPYGFTSKHFTDGHHPTSEAMAIILDDLNYQMGIE
jgi:hypothetical protein